MAIISSNKENQQIQKSSNDHRIVDPSTLSEDIVLHGKENIRPYLFEDFIGQSELKKVLNISIQASLVRKEALDHVLLSGPPGLGKTTMASILSNELKVTCHITSAPALERPRDIIGLLVNMKPHDVLFIDELHRLTRVSEELLYPAMEDFRIDLTVGKGSTSRIRKIDISPFTLVGATTRPASISAPLRDRFGISQRFDFYSEIDLANIVKRSAQLLNFNLDEISSYEIAKRSRGTPRIANRLVKRVRDYATFKKRLNSVDQRLVDEALQIHLVDKKGLDQLDRQFLNLIVRHYECGPVGLDTIAAALGEDSATIECVVEPYLLQIGFIQRTTRGRIVTNHGINHLNLIKKQ